MKLKRIEKPPEKKQKKLTQRQMIEEKIALLEKHDPYNPEIMELKEKLVRSKRGKSSKAKGSTYERDIAKKFRESYNVDLVRTPQSGGFAKKSSKADNFRGDIVPADSGIDLLLHIECKNQKTWNLKSWIEQANEDCPSGKIPVVIMKKESTKRVGMKGNQQDLVVLDLVEFLKLVPKEMIILEV